MRMPSALQKTASPDRIPLVILGAYLLSLVALFLTAGFMPLPLVFVGISIASYFTETRLVGNNPYRWFLRLGLMLVIYLSTPDQARESDWAIGSARLRNLFAQYYAAEVAIQFWRYHPSVNGIGGDPARPRLLILILSGLILLSASNTFDERWIRYIMPVFIILLMIGLYAWRVRKDNLTAAVWRGTALLAALSLGFGAYLTVYRERGQLNDIGARLLRVRPNYEGSGMAQTPHLGETFDLRGTPTRILRIQQFAGDPHWRGMAFTEYRDGRWGPSFVDRQYQEINDRIVSPSAAFRRRDLSEVTVTRLTSDNTLVYAPLSLATLNLGDEEPSGSVALSTGGPFRLRAPAPYIYLVSLAGTDYYQGILATPITPELRTQCLRLPDDFDPRVVTFARSLVTQAGAKTPQEKAAAITAHLISTHEYSLRYHPTTDDPVVGFILSQPGAAAHCEYFAASAALMLRAVGVPTRYVTGYLAHETESANTVIVRQRDAHAWCEAYIDGVGWVTVDATPGSGRPDVTPEKVEKWRTAYEWLQDRWSQFLGFLSDVTSNSLNNIIAAILALMVVWGLILYVRRRRGQKPVAVWDYSAAPPGLAELARRFERVLTQVGAPPMEAVPYDEQLQNLYAQVTLREHLGSFLPLAQSWVRQYDRARWGHFEDGRNAEDTRTLLHQLLTQVEAQAAQLKPLSRTPTVNSLENEDV